MKSRTLGFLLLALFGLASPFGNWAAQATTAANNKDTVRQQIAGFAETWNRHDMDAFGALFAADADFVNVTGQWWKGRPEIQRRHAFTHGMIPRDSVPEALPRNYGIFRASTYHFDSIEVRFVRQDFAIVHAAWTMLGDARTSEPRHGMMTFLVSRHADRWLIDAAQNTEIERRVS